LGKYRDDTVVPARLDGVSAGNFTQTIKNLFRDFSYYI
jgi:hypothetical protein